MQSRPIVRVFLYLTCVWSLGAAVRDDDESPVASSALMQKLDSWQTSASSLESALASEAGHALAMVLQPLRSSGSERVGKTASLLETALVKQHAGVHSRLEASDIAATKLALEDLKNVHGAQSLVQAGLALDQQFKNDACAGAKAQECAESYRTGSSLKHEKENKTIDSRHNHKRCRNKQLAAYKENALASESVRSFVAALVSGDRNASDMTCVLPSERHAGEARTAKWLSDLADQASADKNQLQELQDHQDNTWKDLAAITSTCDGLQLSFEADYCTWQSAIANASKYYQDCRENALVQCHDSAQNRELAQTSLKMSAQTNNVSVCYLEALLKNEPVTLVNRIKLCGEAPTGAAAQPLGGLQLPAAVEDGGKLGGPLPGEERFAKVEYSGVHPNASAGPMSVCVTNESSDALPQRL